MNNDLERLKQLNDFARTKHPGLVGVEITYCGEDKVEGEFVVTEPVVAGTGYLWAPVIITLADWLASAATSFHIPSTHSFTTIELKTNFLSSAQEGQTVSGVATPAHLGRTTHVWDVEIRNKTVNKTIALFRCTQMILAPKP